MRTVVVAMIGAMFIGAGCSSGVDNRRPYEELVLQAQSAIVQAGGVDVLGEEARLLLKNPPLGRLTPSKDGSQFPAITRLHDTLNPLPDFPWIVAQTESVPAHITVRFGTHRRYAYVWIFDPDRPPSRPPEGVLAHVGNGVYVTKVNQ